MTELEKYKKAFEMACEMACDYCNPFICPITGVNERFISDCECECETCLQEYILENVEKK